MQRVSNLAAFFFIWSCGFCYAVQVFVKGAHGMVSWKDTPNWRDRSVVPTPAPADVQAYKKRGEIPHPYPRVHIVKHVYVPARTGMTKGRRLNKKKNLIQRIFFSLPVGAELPIYYTHKQVSGSHKKSTVVNTEEIGTEGKRYFSDEINGPFRSSTWGLQEPLGNHELSPDLETRTIARQNLLQNENDLEGLRYHGMSGQYLRPRTVDRHRIMENNSALFLKRPRKTQEMFYRRLRIPGTKKVRRNIKQKSKGKNVKKSGLPKAGETIGDIMTKLRPAKKDKK
ncbi:uncharacterized protein LOC111322859 isoform X2 [Stylophora pistillata]|uniref:uncharacterized protein LOC111322859 isoform X2 n=1 Tax=Stylophora pistillata TaxID=50429 RepID=UPI000C044718|nr:uncharacterized protein LOC111322859 isoform X2 [Stylophora pistillata]